MFTTEGTSIIHSVQCWRIDGNTKTKQNVKSIKSTNIGQLHWIKCEMDIKSGYEHEFLLNIDRAEDIIIETIFVQLPGKNVFCFEKAVPYL